MMHTDKEQAKPMRAILSVIEVMDEALMQEGWTREGLDAQKRTGDLIAELMAEGYEGDAFDAELECRIAQRKSSDADNSGVNPRTAQRRIRQQAALKLP